MNRNGCTRRCDCDGGWQQERVGEGRGKRRRGTQACQHAFALRSTRRAAPLSDATLRSPLPHASPGRAPQDGARPCCRCGSGAQGLLMRTDIGSGVVGRDLDARRRSDASTRPASASCAARDAVGAVAGRARLRGSATGRDGVVVENKERHETLLTREEVITGFFERKNGRQTGFWVSVSARGRLSPLGVTCRCAFDKDGMPQ